MMFFNPQQPARSKAISYVFKRAVNFVFFFFNNITIIWASMLPYWLFDKENHYFPQNFCSPK